MATKAQVVKKTTALNVTIGDVLYAAWGNNRSIIFDAPTGSHFTGSGNHSFVIEAWTMAELWNEASDELAYGLTACPQGCDGETAH
jgi:hypothetical protein